MVAVATGGVVVGNRDGAAGARRRELTPAEAARRGAVVGRLLRPAAVAEDERAGEGRRRRVAEAFAPAGAWHEWLCDRVATLTARIDRAERVEVVLRDRAAYRAFDFWEEDQRLAAEVLATRLGRDPARTVLKLRQTPAGLDWLAARWRTLARLGPDGWQDEHRELAARLLGGDDLVDPTAPGFAAAQIEAIEAARPRVEEYDALRRRLVEADLSDDDVPDLARLRRQLRQWYREIEWCVAQLRAARPAHAEAAPPTPAQHVAPANEEQPFDETNPTPAKRVSQIDETKPSRPAAEAVPPGRVTAGAARIGSPAARGGHGPGRRY